MAAHRKYVSLSQAQDLIGASLLLGALKDGTLKARGRFNADVETQEPSADFSEIEVGRWHDGRVSFESGSLSFEIRAAYEDDPPTRAGYSHIEVPRDDLEALRIPSRAVNRGGRPAKYRWDLVISELNRRIDYGDRLHFPSESALYDDLRHWYYSVTGVYIPSSTQVRRVVIDLVRQFDLPYRDH